MSAIENVEEIIEEIQEEIKLEIEKQNLNQSQQIGTIYYNGDYYKNDGKHNKRGGYPSAFCSI